MAKAETKTVWRQKYSRMSDIRFKQKFVKKQWHDIWWSVVKIIRASIN